MGSGTSRRILPGGSSWRVSYRLHGTCTRSYREGKIRLYCWGGFRLIPPTRLKGTILYKICFGCTDALNRGGPTTGHIVTVLSNHRELGSERGIELRGRFFVGHLQDYRVGGADLHQ